MLLLSSADFFKINFFKIFFQRLSNSLHLDQDRHSVGYDLGPTVSNPLQRLSAEVY